MRGALIAATVPTLRPAARQLSQNDVSYHSFLAARADYQVVLMRASFLQRKPYMRKHLATYLNDHLAGSVAAIELLEDLIESAGDAGAASFFTQLKTDIEADQQQLRDLIHRCKLAESGPRKAVAWIAGKIVELKSRIEDRSTGPLARLEALEALVLGITGKLALWRALTVAQETASELSLDYDHLAERAKDQRRRVESARLEAAREALGTGVNH